MKRTLLEVGKKAVFSQFLKNPSNGINVSLAWVLSIDENVIKVNHDKDIKFFSQNLVNIALEAGRCVGKPQRYSWYSKWPYQVRNAVFYLSPSFIFIQW